MHLERSAHVLPLLGVALKMQSIERKAVAMEESQQQVQLVDSASFLAMMMPRQMARQVLKMCKDRTRPRTNEM